MRGSMTAIKSDPDYTERIYYHGWDLGDLADPQEGMVRPWGVCQSVESRVTHTDFEKICVGGGAAGSARIELNPV